jgi:hypothetical protein
MIVAPSCGTPWHKARSISTTKANARPSAGCRSAAARSDRRRSSRRTIGAASDNAGWQKNSCQFGVMLTHKLDAMMPRPLCPQSDRDVRRRNMSRSATCGLMHCAANTVHELLLDHFGGNNKVFGHGDPKSLGGFKVDDEIVCCWRHHRQLAWSRSFQDFSYVSAELTTRN